MMKRGEHREQAIAFLQYADRFTAHSLSATYQVWSRSKDLTVSDRSLIWLLVKRYTDTDAE